MNILKKPKYQVLEVTLPISSAVNTLVEQSIRLDPDYRFCTGVAVSLAGNATLGGAGYVNVGLRDMTGTIHDPCHIENWQANAGVQPNNKFKRVKIPLDGRLVFGQIQAPATTPLNTTSAVTVQFIFRLEDTEETIARVDDVA